MYSKKQDPITREKNRKESLSFQNYFKTPAFKYLSEIYKDIDRERLTKLPESNTAGKQKNSYDAQRYLRSLLTLCVEEKCKNGLNGKNQFERIRNYKNFVNEYLDDLRKWSTTFFTNISVIGYGVSSLVLGSYDFDKNGYWVSLPTRKNYFGLDYTSTDGQYFFKFPPETTYGNKLLNKINQVKYIKGEVLVKISPEKAEELVNKKISDIYLVSKVKVLFNGLDTASHYFHRGLYSYHFESPVLEVYEDAALTHKISEILLENLTYKED